MFQISVISSKKKIFFLQISIGMRVFRLHLKTIFWMHYYRFDDFMALTESINEVCKEACDVNLIIWQYKSDMDTEFGSLKHFILHAIKVSKFFILFMTLYAFMPNK